MPCPKPSVSCGSIRELPQTYGWKFLLTLVGSQLFLKGLYMGIGNGGALPLFQDVYGVSGLRYHNYITVIALPWASKALLAMFADLVPVFGYHKRYYVCMGSVLASVSAFVIAGMWDRLDPKGVAALLATANAGVCIVDLLIEVRKPPNRQRPNLAACLAALASGPT